MNDTLQQSLVNDRVDGKRKVTGAAKYAAEIDLPKMAYAVFVDSTIAKGQITSFDLKKAKGAGGVIEILTHENKTEIPALADEAKAKEQRLGLRVFHTNEIFSSGQPIALVVAEKLEQALYAASLVKVNYAKSDSDTAFDKKLEKSAVKTNGKDRGDISALSNAVVKHEAEYMMPMEVHNPMEMHATTAYWPSADKLVLYDKTQGVKGVQRSMANLFGLKPENVTVNAEFVGGGFGSGLRVWANTIAAVMAAKKIGRPVKLMLTRPQMFTMVGYRPEAWQKISIGATADGKFTGIIHDAIGQTSTYENFTEGITGMTRILYDFPNLQTKYATLPLNVNTPVWMRGPGEATGAWALETAIDELSYKLNMDPVELRKINIPEKDPENGLPWSSNFFAECLDKGAQEFGWNRRQQKTGSVRDGDWMVGFGVGCGTWRAGRGGASARVVLYADSRLLVQNAGTDIGPGTGTAISIIASENTGIPQNKIKVEIGSSDYPDAPSQGGSRLMTTVGSAVADACVALKKKVLELAVQHENGFANVAYEDVNFNAEGLAAKNNNSKISYKDLLNKAGLKELDITQASKAGEEVKKYSFNSFAVHFAEVHVHTLTGVPRIRKFVSVVDGGRIVSPKTATSQVTGAVVGGVGMALMEEQLIDHRYGRQIANDLAGYHFPVNADMPHVQCFFINKPDPYLQPLGAKGIGEVGIIGSASAIGNAIYNATGKRIRELPILPEKLV